MTPADRISVEARVLAYVAGAMTDHFDDESFAAYDVTTLWVEAPRRLAGRVLSVCHDQPVPPDSLWRVAGRRVRFVLAPDELTGLDLLFTGALRDVEEIP